MEEAQEKLKKDPKIKLNILGQKLYDNKQLWSNVKDDTFAKAMEEIAKNPKEGLLKYKNNQKVLQIIFRQQTIIFGKMLTHSLEVFCKNIQEYN